MAELAQDYGTTVDPATYISGLQNHIWLGAMYARMIQRVRAEIERPYRQGHANESLQILDIGCGPGHFTTSLAQSIRELLYEHNRTLHVDIVGLDSSPAFIDFANRRRKIPNAVPPNVRFFNMDVRTFNTSAPLTHIITTSGFFHHFRPEEKPEIMRAVVDRLKPGGILIDGDEYIPNPEDFEMRADCRGFGRYIALCSLYFQVITAAHSIGDPDLAKAETENFLAEAFRDDPEVAIPHLPEVELIEKIKEGARSFVWEWRHFGREKAALVALRLRDSFVVRRREGVLRPTTYVDRGDFKTTHREFVSAMTAMGLEHEATYDPGNCEALGSAPVTVFRKPI